MMTDTAEPMLLPTLYRGDSLPQPVLTVNAKHRGRTFAEYYVTEGLLAKAADGGRSNDLRRPLEQLVAIHVGYRTTNDSESYAAYHSPLISFSAEESAAWHFLDRTAKRTFSPCQLDNATHFMWKLSSVQARLISPGHFRFEFSASTKNVDRFREELVGAVYDGDLSKLPQALATQIVHGYVQRDPGTHVADLVDVETFVGKLNSTRHDINPEVLSRAREFGSRWKEWLLYPMDVEPGLQGFSSRFSLKDNLDLHLFARDATS